MVVGLIIGLGVGLVGDPEEVGIPGGSGDGVKW